MIHAATQKRTLRRAARRLIGGIIVVGVFTFGLILVLGHAPPLLRSLQSKCVRVDIIDTCRRLGEY